MPSSNNRKRNNGNRTNAKRPATNNGDIMNRNPTSINISKTPDSTRKTALPNNNQRKAAKNYVRHFQNHAPSISRINERNPPAISVKKQTAFTHLKSGKSKDIKRPTANKSNVIGRTPTPTKVARPTPFQSRKNLSNKPLTKPGE